VDKAKIEEDMLKVMEQVEKQQGENKELGALLDSEKSKLETMRGQITGKIAELQGEIDALVPERGRRRRRGAGESARSV